MGECRAHPDRAALSPEFLPVVIQILATVLVAAPPPPSPASLAADTAVYRIDVSHSRLVFRIRHLVSKVEGRFQDWEGTLIMVPGDLGTGEVRVDIAAASIDTDNERRDADLRSANFFAADSFPEITFRSTAVTVTGDRLAVDGLLTIRGTTRPVTLRGEYIGRMGSGPGERLGFEARTTIDRTAFGVTWNRAVEGGGVLLGDEVEIEMTIAAVRTREG